MSRTLADFPVEDADLYFRGTFCLYLPTNEPVKISTILSADEAVVVASDGNQLRATLSDLTQWWPESRGINVIGRGGRRDSFYCSRKARRQSRRSMCSNTVDVLPTSGGTEPFTVGMAVELHTQANYVPLKLAALREYMETYDDQVLSVCLGRRLFYTPMWSPTVGKLSYSHLGMVGLLDITTGEYQPVSMRSYGCQRAAHSIERLLS